MIKINKEESMMIREKAPQAHIAITNRGKPYKGYYVEETEETKRLLRQFRGEPEPPKKKPSNNQKNRNRGSGYWKATDKN